MHQATRRLDVDVEKWLREVGVTAAKDALTMNEIYKLENQYREGKINRLREPAAALARKLLG